MRFTSSTSIVRRIIIDKAEGMKDQVGICLDANEQGARRFCYYLYRRGIGAKHMPSSQYKGYDWFTYATCRGLNKEQVLDKVLPACKRKTSDIQIKTEDVIDATSPIKNTVKGRDQKMKKGMCIECRAYTDVIVIINVAEDEGICVICNQL